MPRALTESQLDHYRQHGYVFPVTALSADEVERYGRGLDEHLQRARGVIRPAYKHKLHLVSRWADELVHHPSILDAVEDILGPDILCWTTNLLVKEGGRASYVSWHQDSGYWALEPHEVVTAWVALTPSTTESGCVRVLPDSHLPEKNARHRDTFDKDNMLTRGQELADEINEQDAVDMELAAGEISLHHIRLFHGSAANRSNDRRTGIAIRYMSSRVRKTKRPESAMLCRGQAGNGNFLPESRPDGDFTTDARLCHNRAVRLQVANNYDPVGNEPAGTRLRLALERSMLTGFLDAYYAKWKLDQALGREPAQPAVY
ncbi:MAG: phytanoyl-CoA dioxygenase family protein [Deltaproteobacteria bacterium]|nr:phytanoyl-CoA dioxygenase family protein [Deltaproteobacteria bacterium]